jgi:outer membrane protein assembly factor BamA
MSSGQRIQSSSILFLTVFALFHLMGAEAFAQKIKGFQSTDTASLIVLRSLYVDFNRQVGVSNDSVAQAAALRQTIKSLQGLGYLEARVDSFESALNGGRAWFHTGPIYRMVRLRFQPEDVAVLGAAGVKEKYFRKKPLTPAAFAVFFDEVLRWCTNNGFPFASVHLDSVNVEEGRMEARVVLERGNPVLLDSALIKGGVNIADAYLYNYLQIKPGSPYNEAVLQRISTRVREIPFLSESRPAEVEFSVGKARPVLFVQRKNASQFNGVVGVQPDNIKPGKVFVTGDIRLRLLNAFGRAELLDVNWSNPLPRSQDLKVKFSYPFLANSPVGIEGDLMLFKKDSTFLELNRQLAFRYFFSGLNSVRLFLGRKTSALISTEGYENATSLPSFADVGTNTYGLGFQYQQLDYRLNPRRGVALDMQAGAGIREIQKNSRINPDLYENLNLRSTQYKADLQLDVYLPLMQRGVLNLGMLGGGIKTENLFSNELYRFGGLKTLRGFDEQSLLASSYVIGKMEYRFLLEQNSYLLLFYNQAWYEDRSRPAVFTDRPYGFGAGITFDAKLGIFSFTYALGSQQGNPIEFRAAKIHFGLLNFF